MLSREGNMTGTTTPAPRRAPARRAARPGPRRARGLAGTIGVTLLGALLPGAGFLWARRWNLGFAVLLPAVSAVATVVWLVARDPRAMVDVAFDPARLQVGAGVLAGALTLWVLVVATTYLVVKPAHPSRTQSVLGGLFVLVLCLGIAAPVLMGARYAMVQADLVETLFEDNESATTPRNVTEKDPWAGRDRVNLLLLGGDGNVHRDGVRTDSMILASIDTRTGRTVMFSLPRNLEKAQFPVDSPLHGLYPDGFTGYTDEANWLLNAVYGQVPILHPGILGRSDNEGADALKQAVSGSLGVPVDYYVLVNLLGFRQLVDAMGGVTVNINVPIPIGGNSDLGIAPDGYLQPGPDQRLDGFEALWYSRGRYGSDDYQRMERQRCMIDAIVEEAQPLTLLRRYQDLAATGKQIVRTDIPSDLMPAFVDLALEVKDASVRSVVFRSSDQFFPGDPDFAWMQSVVHKALSPVDRTPPADGGPPTTPGPSESASPSGVPTPEPGDAVDAADACAYQPVS
jgi:LCP family protein required for cell wall assembly